MPPTPGHRKRRGFGELSPNPEILASPAPAVTQVEIKATSMRHQQRPQECNGDTHTRTPKQEL